MKHKSLLEINLFNQIYKQTYFNQENPYTFKEIKKYIKDYHNLKKDYHQISLFDYKHINDYFQNIIDNQIKIKKDKIIKSKQIKLK